MAAWAGKPFKSVNEFRGRRAGDKGADHVRRALRGGQFPLAFDEATYDGDVQTHGRIDGAFRQLTRRVGRDEPGVSRGREIRGIVVCAIVASSATRPLAAG